ncbi:MAG: hypothetical protein JWM68_3765 [Verrucomicrobiales bacterium]|nr:hypothetical protein [Verrucomicrobiales bacterium]
MDGVPELLRVGLHPELICGHLSGLSLALEEQDAVFRDDYKVRLAICAVCSVGH